MAQVEIVPKPDWVSWEDVQQCLMQAHDDIRAQGIAMAHHRWPTEKIQRYMEDGGILFVALDGEKLVGTAGLGKQNLRFWYEIGKCGNVCFDCVLPEYAGQGIFRMLDAERERYAREQGYDILLFDTHSRNERRLRIARAAGYRKVRYFRAFSKDHFNVIMVKWLGACPFSGATIRVRYLLSKLLTRIQYRPSGKPRGKFTQRFCKKVNTNYFRYYYDI